MSRSPRVDHGKAVEELHNALREKLTNMASSDDWINYLSAARTFHRYSPQNQMLLAMQGAEGHVAGYRTWQRIPSTDGGTCQVAKGQSGLRILAPMKGSAKTVDETTGDEVTKHFLRGFRTVKVFHQGQLVASPDIGEDAVAPALLTGANRWQDVFSAVKEHLEADGYDVGFQTPTPTESWNGYTDYNAAKVRIASTLEGAQQVKTLLHEWAHVQLDHHERSVGGLTRDMREVEAESVAYLLGQTIGLDSQGYSVPYITGWSGGDPKLIEQTALKVLETTKQLVGTLEHELGVKLIVDLNDFALPDADTNVIELPGASAATPVAPLTAAASRPEQRDLSGVSVPAISAIERSDSSDKDFLTALRGELDEHQAQDLVKHIYRIDHSAEVATILADSGQSALQAARILTRFGRDVGQVNEALLTATGDSESPTMYPPDEVAAAIHEITLPELRSTPTIEAPVDIARGERLLSMKVLRRVALGDPTPTTVVEMAKTLEVSSAEVVRVLASVDANPSTAVAVAVAMNNGDGAKALRELKDEWPGIEGSWEYYAHPSMLPSPAVDVPEPADPMLAILDSWRSSEPAAPSTPEPSAP
ncbi:MAG: hypothetical protein ACE37B_11370 [Ilumatobacter sp.]|uniref:hypothetical protein n=1 Tax=Ilumatobacter sp. TaxID=1967498 RepID=UPI00391C1CFE